MQVSIKPWAVSYTHLMPSCPAMAMVSLISVVEAATCVDIVLVAEARAANSISTPVLAMGTAAVKASLDFESSFTSVRKTVDATETEFAALASATKTMSTQVAASTTEINETMAIAGQLGIQNDYLVDFTRTMIDLGNSTNIVAGDAASCLLYTSAIKAAKARASLGEISSALEKHFGRHKAPIKLITGVYAQTYGQDPLVDVYKRQEPAFQGVPRRFRAHQAYACRA